MRNNWRLALLPALLLGGFFISGKTNAASQPPSGITVSPAFQQVSIESTESSQPVTFTITNNKTSAQSIILSSADFNTLSETGGLFFVGANPTELQKKYGLSQWLDLPQKDYTLQPKQTIKVTASILNQASLQPGGHYGALMVSSDDGTSGATTNNVSVHPIASSLLFVTKLGGDTHKLSLSNVYIKHSLLRLPSSVTLRFHNDGNTHVTPRGSVSVYDARDRLISKGIINEDSGIILPSAYRRYSVDLSRVTFPRLPGKYTLKVDFRFDGIDQYRRYSTSFFSVPRLASGLEILALLLILGSVVFIAVRNYRSYRK